MKNKLLPVLAGMAALIVFMSVFVNCSTNYSGAENKDRIEFIESFGWKVQTNPVEEVNLVLPSEYDDVYKEYNKLQKAAGMDIKPYLGKSVTRYTYIIENHRKTKDGKARANLLVCGGNIIAADVMVVDIGGFMHSVNKSEYVKK